MANSTPKLTAKQAAFCREYLVDLCGAKAAIRAGYAESGASVEGSRLLAKANIQARIAKLKAERSERTNIAADDVLRYWARVMTGDMRELVKWGPDGVELVASDSLPPDAAAMVDEVSQGPHGVRLKRPSRIRASELTARHLGMFIDRVAVASTDRDFSHLSDDELHSKLDRLIPSLGYERRSDASRRPRCAPEPRTAGPVRSLTLAPSRAPGALPAETPETTATDTDTDEAQRWRQILELEKKLAELRDRLGERPVGPPEEW